ncbi:helix-turn-helix transcriptional regulator [Solihabitans fulvus]|uniref:Helix-turn-helix transcriptional regulator n=1 Tax=Solihabitans fulvus TaxID=1892852 RepID=A0A5B2WXU4_9PSEU|nr:helix-turn-helix transcriptional regulator [Solihabitans fulvus]KAA2255209.1 helix-turn-helix transcriptional regulator [Solihabitans fulvus]
MGPDGAAGRRIRELRLARGLSQAYLSGPGLSTALLSMIESGRRAATSATVARLAELLGSTVEYLETGEQPPTWQEIERVLAFAEIALHHGSSAQALADFDAVLAGGPPPFAARARLGRARALESLNRFDDAIAEFDALARQADPGGAEWAERNMDAARCYGMAGDESAAIELGERALGVVEELGLDWTNETIRLGVTLAGAYRSRGDVVRAEALLRRLLAAADEMGSPLARGSAMWNAALVAYDRGRLGDARLLAERALALIGETGHERNIATLRAVYGSVLALAEPGEAARALAILREAHGSLLEVANPTGVARCEVAMAETALLLGDPGLSMTYARAAADRVRGLRGIEEPYAVVALAEAAHADGDPGTATAAMDEAAALLDAVDQSRRAKPHLWQRIAVFREETGDTTGALEAYRRAMLAAGFPGRVRHEVRTRSGR